MERGKAVNVVTLSEARRAKLDQFGTADWRVGLIRLRLLRCAQDDSLPPLHYRLSEVRTRRRRHADTRSPTPAPTAAPATATSTAACRLGAASVGGRLRGLVRADRRAAAHRDQGDGLSGQELPIVGRSRFRLGGLGDRLCHRLGNGEDGRGDRYGGETSCPPGVANGLGGPKLLGLQGGGELHSELCEMSVRSRGGMERVADSLASEPHPAAAATKAASGTIYDATHESSRDEILLCGVGRGGAPHLHRYYA
jgi:hypothetical protein